MCCGGRPAWKSSRRTFTPDELAEAEVATATGPKADDLPEIVEEGTPATWSHDDLVALAITPAQSLLATAHRGALSAWHTFTDWKTVRIENMALRADNERLRVQSLQVRETDQENRRLR
jgi:hypothetical protein